MAEESGEIAGYCGLVMAPDEGDVTNVSVAKNRRRQGIGAMLVRELIRRAGENGVTKLYLEVRESNQAAIALYESLGFKKDGVRRDYYEEPREKCGADEQKIAGFASAVYTSHWNLPRRCIIL